MTDKRPTPVADKISAIREPISVHPSFEDDLDKALKSELTTPGAYPNERAIAKDKALAAQYGEGKGGAYIDRAGAYVNGKWVPDAANRPRGPEVLEENLREDSKAPRTATPAKRVARAERIKKVLDTREYTGGSTSYYELDILHPHKKRRPYMAECLDIIEALGMSFAEGECFKAIWRKCAARQGKAKRGYDDAKYDAEKIAFYAQRILDDVITPKGNKA